MATPLEEIHEYVDRNRKIEPYTENERKQLIMQLAQQQIRQQRNNQRAFALMLEKAAPSQRTTGGTDGLGKDKKAVQEPVKAKRDERFDLDVVQELVLTDLQWGQPSNRQTKKMGRKVKTMELDIDSLILPPVPDNDSPETYAELLEAQEMGMLREERADDISAQGRKDGIIATFKKYSDENDLMTNWDFVRMVIDDVQTIVLNLKFAHNRVRPSTLAQHLGVVLPTHDDVGSPSYPSFHSTVGRVVASVISGAYVGHRERLMQIGDTLGMNRIIGGYHFLTDHQAGQSLGDQLVLKITQNLSINPVYEKEETIDSRTAEAVAVNFMDALEHRHRLMEVNKEEGSEAHYAAGIQAAMATHARETAHMTDILKARYDDYTEYDGPLSEEGKKNRASDIQNRKNDEANSVTRFTKTTKSDGYTKYEHSFLSNFAPSEVGGWKLENGNWVSDGETYPTAEHAYQASKFKDEKHRSAIRNANTAGKAKRIAKKLLTGDRTLAYMQEKGPTEVRLMSSVLNDKFRSNAGLAKQLTDTGLVPLIEGNDWGDVFWGQSGGKGENNLGELLMRVRQDIYENPPTKSEITRKSTTGTTPHSLGLGGNAPKSGNSQKKNKPVGTSDDQPRATADLKNRLLITGGRDNEDYDDIYDAIKANNPDVVIHGGAKGADANAEKAAKALGIPTEVYPVTSDDWDTKGTSAGHQRNAQMLEEGEPTSVIAFRGGKGTAGMVKLAEKAGFEVEKPQDQTYNRKIPSDYAKPSPDQDNKPDFANVKSTKAPPPSQSNDNEDNSVPAAKKEPVEESKTPNADKYNRGVRRLEEQISTLEDAIAESSGEKLTKVNPKTGEEEDVNARATQDLEGLKAKLSTMQATGAPPEAEAPVEGTPAPKSTPTKGELTAWERAGSPRPENPDVDQSKTPLERQQELFPPTSKEEEEARRKSAAELQGDTDNVETEFVTPSDLIPIVGENGLPYENSKGYLGITNDWEIDSASGGDREFEPGKGKKPLEDWLKSIPRDSLVSGRLLAPFYYKYGLSENIGNLYDLSEFLDTFVRVEMAGKTATSREGFLAQFSAFKSENGTDDLLGLLDFLKDFSPALADNYRLRSDESEGGTYATVGEFMRRDESRESSPADLEREAEEEEARAKEAERRALSGDEGADEDEGEDEPDNPGFMSGEGFKTYLDLYNGWSKASVEERLMRSKYWRERRQPLLDGFTEDRLAKFLNDAGLTSDDPKTSSPTEPVGGNYDEWVSLNKNGKRANFDIEYVALYHGLGLRKYRDGDLMKLMMTPGALDDILDDPEKHLMLEWINPVLKEKISELKNFRDNLSDNDRPMWNSLTSNSNPKFKNRSAEFFKKAFLHHEGPFAAMSQVFKGTDNLRDRFNPYTQPKTSDELKIDAQEVQDALLNRMPYEGIGEPSENQDQTGEQLQQGMFDLLQSVTGRESKSKYAGSSPNSLLDNTDFSTMAASLRNKFKRLRTDIMDKGKADPDGRGSPEAMDKAFRGLHKLANADLRALFHTLQLNNVSSPRKMEGFDFSNIPAPYQLFPDKRAAADFGASFQSAPYSAQQAIAKNITSGNVIDTDKFMQSVRNKHSDELEGQRFEERRRHAETEGARHGVYVVPDEPEEYETGGGDLGTERETGTEAGRAADKDARRMDKLQENVTALTELVTGVDNGTLEVPGDKYEKAKTDLVFAKAELEEFAKRSGQSEEKKRVKTFTHTLDDELIMALNNAAKELGDISAAAQGAPVFTYEQDDSIVMSAAGKFNAKFEEVQTRGRSELTKTIDRLSATERDKFISELQDTLDADQMPNFIGVHEMGAAEPNETVSEEGLPVKTTGMRPQGQIVGINVVGTPLPRGSVKSRSYNRQHSASLMNHILNNTRTTDQDGAHWDRFETYTAKRDGLTDTGLAADRRRASSQGVSNAMAGHPISKEEGFDAIKGGVTKVLESLHSDEGYVVNGTAHRMEDFLKQMTVGEDGKQKPKYVQDGTTSPETQVMNGFLDQEHKTLTNQYNKGDGGADQTKAPLPNDLQPQAQPSGSKPITEDTAIG